MKNKKILRVIIIFLCLIVMSGTIFFCNEQRRIKEERAKQGILAIDYREQNRAFPRVAGRPIKEEYYVGYDAIDEPQLYVCLSAYNEWIRLNYKEESELTLEDIEKYLSSEYNEDGSLRIQKGYENIRAYVDWYYEEGGGQAITEYWGDLEDIKTKYNVQNPELELCNAKEMNISQLQELINKKNDPSYEINIDVMKGQ